MRKSKHVVLVLTVSRSLLSCVFLSIAKEYLKQIYEAQEISFNKKAGNA